MRGNAEAMMRRRDMLPASRGRVPEMMVMTKETETDENAKNSNENAARFNEKGTRRYAKRQRQKKR